MNLTAIQILERVFNVPLMVTPEKLAVVCGYLTQRYNLQVWSAPLGAVADAAIQESASAAMPGRGSETGYAVTPGGAGIVPIHGSLAHRTGGMVQPESGIMNYDGIRQMFRAAMADPAVKEIVLDVNSHGGEVSGVFDLAAEIFDARGKGKTITAVVNEIGASAAYLLASAADAVVLPSMGMAGSVGVVARHTDLSKANEANGLTVTYIYAGDRKIDGNPDNPLTDAALASIQGRVNETYDRFAEAVAKYRGMTVAAVKATQAAVYRGAAAVAVGVADKVLPAHAVYAGGANAVLFHRGG